MPDNGGDENVPDSTRIEGDGADLPTSVGGDLQAPVGDNLQAEDCQIQWEHPKTG